MLRTAALAALIAIPTLLSAQDHPEARAHLTAEAARVLTGNFKAQVQRLQGAANGIRVQGRALFENDYARIAWYEERIAILSRAASSLELALRAQPFTLSAEEETQVLKAQEVMAGSAEAPLHLKPEQPLLHPFPQAAPKAKEDPVAEPTADPKRRITQLQRRAEVLEVEQKLAEVRAQRFELERRLVELEIKEIGLAARLQKFRAALAEVDGAPDVRNAGVRSRMREESWVARTVYEGLGAEVARQAHDQLFAWTVKQGLEFLGPVLRRYPNALAGQPRLTRTELLMVVKATIAQRPLALAEGAFTLEHWPAEAVLVLPVTGPYGQVFDQLPRLLAEFEARGLKPAGALTIRYLDDEAKVPAAQLRAELEIPVSEK